MGGSDEPDPRLEFPKFQKDELIAFRSKVEANGDLTFDKVLAGPLGFYLFSSWAARDAPPCAKHAMYFVRDVVKLREACGAKKISKADADLQSSFVPFNAAKFRKNDKYTGTSMRRKAGAVVDDALYAQHVSTDAAAPFPIAKVAALVDASAAAQVPLASPRRAFARRSVGQVRHRRRFVLPLRRKSVLLHLAGFRFVLGVASVHEDSDGLAASIGMVPTLSHDGPRRLRLGARLQGADDGAALCHEGDGDEARPTPRPKFEKPDCLDSVFIGARGVGGFERPRQRALSERSQSRIERSLLTL